MPSALVSTYAPSSCRVEESNVPRYVSRRLQGKNFWIKKNISLNHPARSLEIAHTQCEAVHTVGALIIGIFNIVYFHARKLVFHHMADDVRLMAYHQSRILTAVLRQGSQCILENSSSTNSCKALRLRQGERLKALAFAGKKQDRLLGLAHVIAPAGSYPHDILAAKRVSARTYWLKTSNACLLF